MRVAEPGACKREQLPSVFAAGDHLHQRERQGVRKWLTAANASWRSADSSTIRAPHARHAASTRTRARSPVSATGVNTTVRSRNSSALAASTPESSAPRHGMGGHELHQLEAQMGACRHHIALGASTVGKHGIRCKMRRDGVEHGYGLRRNGDQNQIGAIERLGNIGTTASITPSSRSRLARIRPMPATRTQHGRLASAPAQRNHRSTPRRTRPACENGHPSQVPARDRRVAPRAMRREEALHFGSRRESNRHPQVSGNPYTPIGPLEQPLTYRRSIGRKLTNPNDRICSRPWRCSPLMIWRSAERLSLAPGAARSLRHQRRPARQR